MFINLVSLLLDWRSFESAKAGIIMRAHAYLYVFTCQVVISKASDLVKPDNCNWTREDCVKFKDLKDVDFITNCYVDISNRAKTCESRCRSDPEATLCKNYCPEYLEACAIITKTSTTASTSTLVKIVMMSPLTMNYPNNSTSYPSKPVLPTLDIENTTKPTNNTHLNSTQSSFSTTEPLITAEIASVTPNKTKREINNSTSSTSTMVVTTVTSVKGNESSFATENVTPNTSNATSTRATPMTQISETSITATTQESQPLSTNGSLPTTKSSSTLKISTVTSAPLSTFSDNDRQGTNNQSDAASAKEHLLPIWVVIAIVFGILFCLAAVGAMIICKVKRRCFFEESGAYTVVADDPDIKNRLPEEPDTNESGKIQLDHTPSGTVRYTKVPDAGYGDGEQAGNETDQQNDRLLK